jgi:hypothetical protein
MDSLKPLVGKMVLVVTLEGRSLVGTLRSATSRATSRTSREVVPKPASTR